MPGSDGRAGATASATTALAQLMVPSQATSNDRELLMLARLQAAERGAAKP